MPTVRPQKNPYQVGHLVKCTHFNGVGEGLLWRVTAVDGVYVRIEVVFTATGPSVINAKRVPYHQVTRVTVADIVKARDELNYVLGFYNVEP